MRTGRLPGQGSPWLLRHSYHRQRQNGRQAGGHHFFQRHRLPEGRRPLPATQPGGQSLEIIVLCEAKEQCFPQKPEVIGNTVMINHGHKKVSGIQELTFGKQLMH